MADCTEVTQITRRRGDTYGDSVIVTDLAGAPIDITGCSFTLTVDPEEFPKNSTNNLFTLTGTILNAVGGIVEFVPSSLQASQSPGVYFFEIKMVDGAGRLRTIRSDKYEFV